MQLMKNDSDIDVGTIVASSFGLLSGDSNIPGSKGSDFFDLKLKIVHSIFIQSGETANCY